MEWRVVKTFLELVSDDTPIIDDTPIMTRATSAPAELESCRRVLAKPSCSQAPSVASTEASSSERLLDVADSPFLHADLEVGAEDGSGVAFDVGENADEAARCDDSSHTGGADQSHEAFATISCETHQRHDSNDCHEPLDDASESPKSKTAKRNQRRRAQKTTMKQEISQVLSVAGGPEEATIACPSVAGGPEESTIACDDKGPPGSASSSSTKPVSVGNRAKGSASVCTKSDHRGVRPELAPQPAAAAASGGSPHASKKGRKKQQREAAADDLDEMLQGSPEVAASLPEKPRTSQGPTPKTEQPHKQPKANAEKQPPKAAHPWKGTNPTSTERLRLKNTAMEMLREESNIRKDLFVTRSAKLMTLEELSNFDCMKERRLVSVHGDIFDVTSNAAEYGPNGARCFEAGADITFSVITGLHTKENCNRIFDFYKAKDDKTLAGRFMILCTSVVAFYRDYGAPIGRLTVFTQEKELPPPALPAEDMADCMMQ